MAVLSFVNLSDGHEWEPMQKGLAEMVITDLAQVEGITVIERLKLDQLMQEIQVSASGLTDPSNSLRIGKLVGAKNLVKGSFLIMTDMKMTLDAGVYPFQNIGAPTAFNFDGNIARVFQIEKELVLRIVEHFGIVLSPQKRQQLLEIPTQNLDAFLRYCRGLDALDYNDYKSAVRFFQEAVQLDPGFQSAKDWLITPELWDATHAQNLNRVDQDVAYLTKRSERGRLVSPLQMELTSTYNRLQTLGMRQNTGLLPGNDSRKSFQEAEMSAPILPRKLDIPPPPPTH